MTNPSNPSPDTPEESNHEEPPAAGLTPSSDQDVPAAAQQSDPKLRKEARARIKRQKGAKQLTGVFLIVWAVCIAVWVFTPDRGHFWPVWVIFGTCIPLGISYWGAYGPSETITDADVEAEMRRMQGGSR